MAPKQSQVTAISSIPLPSADLITYRFDQSDKKFDEMNRKLDTILVQNSQFVSEARVEHMIDAAVANATGPIQHTLTTYRNWGIAIFGGSITIVATLLGIFIKH